MKEITCEYLRECEPTEKNLVETEAKIDTLLEESSEDIKDFI